MSSYAAELKIALEGNCKRVALDVVYTGDGLFIVRMRSFVECYNVELSVKFLGDHVQGSPFCLKQLNPEECSCPRRLDKVTTELQCPTLNRQIQKDLKPFDKLDFQIIKYQILKRFKNFKSSSLCNYVIKGNRVFRKCYGEYVGFNMFMDSMLRSLTRKVLLPDLEFFVNLGDWPLIKKSSPIIPIFSWCGSTETLDIVLPTYELTESTLHMMHRVTLDLISVQREKWKWQEKTKKAFFRGRDSRRERLDLIDIQRKHSDLINASITNFFFFTDEIQKYGPRVGHIPLTDFFRYKFQVRLNRLLY